MLTILADLGLGRGEPGGKKIAQRQTASRYLKELVDLGVLREMAVGKEKLFIHPKPMQLLTKDRNDFTPYDRANRR